MLNTLLKYISVILLFFTLSAFAPKQDNGSGKIKIEESDYENMEIQMADTWHQNGKIYVVVATLGAVLAGFIFYLVLTDRKVSKLEKEIENGI